MALACQMLPSSAAAPPAPVCAPPAAAAHATAVAMGIAPPAAADAAPVMDMALVNPAMVYQSTNQTLSHRLAKYFEQREQVAGLQPDFATSALEVWGREGVCVKCVCFGGIGRECVHDWGKCHARAAQAVAATAAGPPAAQGCPPCHELQCMYICAPMPMPGHLPLPAISAPYSRCRFASTLTMRATAWRCSLESGSSGTDPAPPLLGRGPPQPALPPHLHQPLARPPHSQVGPHTNHSGPCLALFSSVALGSGTDPAAFWQWFNTTSWVKRHCSRVYWLHPERPPAPTMCVARMRTHAGGGRGAQGQRRSSRTRSQHGGHSLLPP